MIKLNDIFQIIDKEKWTICLNNEIEENIYSLLSDIETDKRKNRLLEHISWKIGKDNNGIFRRIDTPYCLQFLRISGYSDRWLFLGAFECVGSHNINKTDEIYDLKRINSFNTFSEKLIVKYKKQQGPKEAKIPYDRYLLMEVLELLPDIYIKCQKEFPGYDNICLTFSEMKDVFLTPYKNWKEALSIINGIYVITDVSNGKQYIGSTYGKDGVWQRWLSYVTTNGHGGDIELIPLIEKDNEYAIKNFQFSLVEYFFNTGAKRANKDLIISREKYWKKVLQSRKFGYNNN